MAEEEKKEDEKEPDRQLPGIEPVERYHSIMVGGETLNYLSRAGVLPLTDDKGKTEAEIFFTAYEVAPEKEGRQRPLTFVFNGGPGSSSIWLHMGACGPRRVKMEPGGWMPAPPFVHEENQSTWLDRTDLVFIDPVETGLSRAVSEKLIDKFWGYQGTSSPLASSSGFIYPGTADGDLPCSSPGRATAPPAPLVWPTTWLTGE